MLRKAIETVLLPELTRRGFEAAPLSGEYAQSREFRSAFPFGRHRRRGQQGRFELVEIQLRQYGASFRLNLGVAQDDVWVHDLQLSYEMYRWPRYRKFFSLWLVPWRWPWSTVTQRDFNELARQVALLFPEIDRLFSDGSCGPHIRKLDLS